MFWYGYADILNSIMSSTHVNPLAPTAIPAFTQSGVLPPYVGSDPAQIAGVSPYETTLSELVQRFGTTPSRRDILRGYLQHRQALIGFGIYGVQWLDGSFVENVEVTQQRSPNDLDIVTFFARPEYLKHPSDWQAFLQSNPTVFMPPTAKAQFKTDPYFVDVSFGPLHVIEQATYWSGLFSHQRSTSLWKGMVKVLLDPQRDDANARLILEKM
jgi:hypothetical protein